MHSESRDKFVHPYIQSTLDTNFSLHGGIPPERPQDIELMRGILSFGSPLLYSREVKTLEESSPVQRVWDRLKEERDILSFSASPTLTTYTALTEVAAGIEDGIFMMQDD